MTKKPTGGNNSTESHLKKEVEQPEGCSPEPIDGRSGKPGFWKMPRRKFLGGMGAAAFLAAVGCKERAGSETEEDGGQHVDHDGGVDGGQPLNLTRPTLSWHTGDGSVGSEAHVTGGEWNEAAAVRRWKFILDEGTANEEVVTPDPIEDGFGGEWQLFIAEEMLGESERVLTALVRGYTEDLSDFVEVAALGALTLPPLHQSEDFSTAAFERYAEPTGWFYVDPVNGADETPPVGGYETVAQAQSNPLRWISNAIPRQRYGDVILLAPGVHMSKNNTGAPIDYSRSSGPAGHNAFEPVQTGLVSPKWIIGEDAENTFVIGSTTGTGMQASAISINHRHVVLANFTAVARVSDGDARSLKLSGSAQSELGIDLCYDITLAGCCFPRSVTVDGQTYTWPGTAVARFTGTSRTRLLGCSFGTPDNRVRMIMPSTGVRRHETAYCDAYTDGSTEAIHRTKTNCYGLHIHHNRFNSSTSTRGLLIGADGMSVADSTRLPRLGGASNIDAWLFDWRGNDDPRRQDGDPGFGEGPWRYWGFADPDHPGNLPGAAREPFLFADGCGRIVNGEYQPALVDWNIIEFGDSIDTNAITFRGSAGVVVRNNFLDGHVRFESIWKGATKDLPYVDPHFDAEGTPLNSGDWRVEVPLSQQSRVAIVGIEPDPENPLTGSMSLGPVSTINPAHFDTTGSPNEWGRWPVNPNRDNERFIPGTDNYTPTCAVVHPAQQLILFYGNTSITLENNFCSRSGEIQQIGNPLTNGLRNVGVNGATRVGPSPSIEMATDVTESGTVYNASVQDFLDAAAAANQVIGTAGWDYEAVLRKLGLV